MPQKKKPTKIPFLGDEGLIGLWDRINRMLENEEL